MVQKMWLPLALMMVASACLVPAYAAEKLSTVAPAADLVTEVDSIIKDLDTKLADYAKNKKKGIPQAAGTLAVLAQAIAAHDEDSAMKKSAADLRDAAIAIAKSASEDDAKKGLEAAKAAAGGKAAGAKADHAWDKLIDMDSLMAEVNARNGKLRKAFRKAPEDHAAASRDASVLAVLGVVIESDTHEVKDKADVEKWKKYSKDLQTSMADVAKALKAKDDAGGKAKFLESAKSCNACHTEIRDK